MPPLVILDQEIGQGDGWSLMFPVVIAGTGAPFPLTGYTADFVVRQNFGDAAGDLIVFSTGIPTANGSSITIVAQAPSTVVNTVYPVVRGADTLALPVNSGQKITRFFAQCRMTPPGGDPITVALLTWYVRSKL